MSNMIKSPVTTPIPVQLSEPEFVAFIFPHLSMPKRGPKCKLGYHRVFNLILWVLYTGMQWKCLPVPSAGDGSAVIHYTTIYKVFARWSDDGSLDQAFIASVQHLAEQITSISASCMAMAPIPSRRKAAMASAIPVINTRRARRS
jgi:transposase